MKRKKSESYFDKENPGFLESMRDFNVNDFFIHLDEIINPVRDEDKGNDLWSVFNVIQEKIITGDFTYLSGARSRKAREVKNFKQDMDINKKLFAMANELVPEEIAS